MSVLYLVRHGQASFGRENYDRLSKRGVEQARIVGDYFIRTGLRFDAYSGASSGSGGRPSKLYPL